MLESFSSNTFEYKKLTEAEQKSRGILGRLVGIIADTVNATRNGRKYSSELWENVFNNPIMQEKIKNKVCFGELGHPADRTETDMEKIAICLAEQPKKGKDGKLYGVFDILDTPNGRILNQLCLYGCNIGISSRGQGDLITDMNGDEAVDPDTYDCECFDAVLVPGVEPARLKYVTESFNQKPTLKKALQESLEKATEVDRKIMSETLKNLNIELEESFAGMPFEYIITVDRDPDHPGEEHEEHFDNAEDANDFVNEHKHRVKEIVKFDYRNGGDLNPDIIPIWKRGKIELDDKEGTVIEDLEDEDIPTIEDEESADVEDLEFPEDSKENDETPSDLPIKDSEEGIEVSDLISDEVSDEEEPTEDVESDDRSDEEIFLDFLANNFDEKQIKKVAKILDIEITDDDGNLVLNTEEAEDSEETEEDEDSKEEKTGDSEKSDDKAKDAEKEDDHDEEEKSSDDDIEDEEEDEEKAVDEGLETLLKNLKEAVKGKCELQSEVKKLQEELAVSNTKVSEALSECEKYKNAVSRLSDVAKANRGLKESNLKLEQSLKESKETIDAQNVRINKLKESKKSNIDLTENLNKEKAAIEDKVSKLNEELVASRDEANKKIGSLTESLGKEQKLKESYRKLANKAVNKYIEVRADVLGLTPTDIKRKLGESYTMEDVDAVCEDLKKYYFNVSKLPISIDKKIGVKVNECSAPRNNGSRKFYEDDDVDDTLIKIANMSF